MDWNTGIEEGGRVDTPQIVEAYSTVADQFSPEGKLLGKATGVAWSC